MKRSLALIITAVLLISALAGCTRSPQQGSESGFYTSVPGPTKHPIDVTLKPQTFAPAEPTPTGDFKDVEMPDTFEPLYWDVIRGGGSSGVGTTWSAYTDYAGFGKEFGVLEGELKEKYGQESFNGMFVVAVSHTVPTGGYSVTLNEAFIKDGAVNIDITVEAPPAGSVTTQALETHTVLAAFGSNLYSERLTYNITVNGRPVGNNAEM